VLRPGVLRVTLREEADRLIDALPEHLKDVVGFALSTGLRMSNILGLQWDKVDMDRRHAVIEGEFMKNGAPLAVPLNEPTMAILRRQQGKHETHVFTFRGEPFREANGNTWRKALKAAGIENFRFHDLRHTWASWMRESGADTRDLQELGGWKTPAMAARYQHLSSERLMRSAKLIDDVVPKRKLKIVGGKG